MYDIVKERKKKQKKLDDFVFGINMYVTSRHKSKNGIAKKTFKLKEAKIECDVDKTEDKQEKLTAEDTLLSSKKWQNVAKPKRKYVFKNKYKQMKKVQNEKIKKVDLVKKQDKKS